MSNKEWYIKNFEQLENSLNGQLSSEVHNIRRKAVSELARLDFPTQRNEEWKYTNPAPLLKFNFVPAITPGRFEKLAGFEDILKLVQNLNADLAVFINGHFSNKLSRLKDGSIRIESLASVMKKEPELVLSHFTKYAAIENGFTALNTAFAFDGAF